MFSRRSDSPASAWSLLARLSFLSLSRSVMALPSMTQSTIAEAAATGNVVRDYIPPPSTGQTWDAAPSPTTGYTLEPTAADALSASDWALLVKPYTRSVASISVGDNNRGVAYVPCDLWFHDSCQSSGSDPDSLGMNGWQWDFSWPVGIGPGVPPSGVIGLDSSGWVVEGDQIAWPQIYVDEFGKPVYPETAPSGCEMRTASAVSTEGGSTIHRVTWSGCHDTALETANAASCTASSNDKAKLEARGLDEPRAVPASTTTHTAAIAGPTTLQTVDRRDPSPSGSAPEEASETSQPAAAAAAHQDNGATTAGCEPLYNFVCYPQYIAEEDLLDFIRGYLTGQRWDFKEIGSKTYGIVAFFHISQVTPSVISAFEVAADNDVYCTAYEQDKYTIPLSASRSTAERRRDTLLSSVEEANFNANETSSGGKDQMIFDDLSSWEDMEYDTMCRISAAHTPWNADPQTVNNGWYRYWRDASAGRGQTIYVVDVDHSLPDHEAFQDGLEPIVLTGQDYGPGVWNSVNHGSQIGALAAGQHFGVAPNAQLVFTALKTIPGGKIWPRVRMLEALVMVLEHIASNPDSQDGRAVLNLSWNFGTQEIDPTLKETISMFKSIPPNPRRDGGIGQKEASETDDMPTGDILELMVEEYQVAIVVAAGNSAKIGGKVDQMLLPMLAKQPMTDNTLSDIIVVGSVDQRTGFCADFSQHFAMMDSRLVYAAGVNVPVPGPDGPTSVVYQTGTSFSTPQVAGLVAYLRGIESKWQDQLKSPALVKQLIMALARPLEDKTGMVKTIWNGQLSVDSCLLPPFNQIGCPIIPTDLTQLNCQGQAKRDGECMSSYTT